MNRSVLLITFLILSFSCLANDTNKETEGIAAFKEFLQKQKEHEKASKLLFHSKIEEDQKKGFDILLKEHEEGSAYSSGKIGWAYQRGLGVEANLEKALELYFVAAKGGNTYWQFLLAHAYEKGYLGLPADKKKMEFWLNYSPKIHIGSYDCWVAYYYEVGIYPSDEYEYRKRSEQCKS